MMGSSIVRASLSRQAALFPTLSSPHSGAFHKLVSCSLSSRLGSQNIQSWRVAINCNFVGERVRKGMATRAGADPPPPTGTVVPPVAPKAKYLVPKMSFCPSCGGTVEERIPTGEHELRNVCTICGSIHYQNPKMVVGCLVEHEEKVLLCKRSIQPSYGLWTLPAGYMELGESAAEGAARETWEEALAEVEVISLFAHLDIPLIGQSYIIFRAKLKHPTFSPGPESLECALFRLEDIPFDMLAFSSIQVALKLYLEDVASGNFRVHHGVIDKRRASNATTVTLVVVLSRFLTIIDTRFCPADLERAHQTLLVMRFVTILQIDDLNQSRSSECHFVKFNSGQLWSYEKHR